MSLPFIDYKNMNCLQYLKTLPDKSINLVLIDPPYVISKDTNFQKGEKTGRDTDRFRISMDFGDWDKEEEFTFEDLKETVKECFRVLKNGGTFICFYDIWKITELKECMEEAKFKQLRFIEWVKTNPVPINSKINYLTNSREIALVGIKGSKPTFNSEYDNGIYRYPICHDKGRFHPTQKPLDLFSELIKKHSNEEDNVLDCFCGSGTTAVSCMKLNRNFYGCELNETYFKKSVDRLCEIDSSFDKLYVKEDDKGNEKDKA